MTAGVGVQKKELPLFTDTMERHGFWQLVKGSWCVVKWLILWMKAD